MNIREMRTELGDTQSEFADRYHIPFRTIQNWEAGIRKPPVYIASLLERQVKDDLINKKTNVLPKYDPRKRDLPKRENFIGALSWLSAVKDCIGEDIVFALDEALMCQGNFGGRNNEYLVWLYGDTSLERFNGVVVLGKRISPFCVLEKSGLRFTDLNRTISDALANQSILDMQGITEAVSRYYFSNGESFKGLSVAPEYQDAFEKLAQEARTYYDS
ncbi:MAG: helix-turn-helix domain-containing protein [Lachnospiraceae bacterium]|nr:helix-turn-helix domain-containing protein [Lachnospiraceae bacterium]MBP3913978.1 helix-turn-helix domain-containing protein [Lachnospiraceae bacterium]